MIPFKYNDRPTLGVEEEFQLVSLETGELVAAVDDVMPRLSDDLRERVCYELLQCVLENRSGPAENVEELMGLVDSGRREIASACRDAGIGLVASGTSAIANWRDMPFAESEHYAWVREYYGYVSHRLLGFGLHVHVALQSAEVAFHVMHEMRRWTYPLLALSANSPFFEEMDTGCDSIRTHLFRSMPRTGFAPEFDEVDQLIHHYDKMCEAGDITRPGDLWWVIRPQMPLGTIEYRVCDLSTDSRRIGALVALLQAATCHYQDEFLAGKARSVMDNSFLDQNSWRCMKNGLEAQVIDPVTEEVLPVREQLLRLLDMVAYQGERLNSVAYLEMAREMIGQPSEATWQRELFRDSGQSYPELIRRLAEATVS